MSTIKEPQYFATDLNQRLIQDEASYRRLFVNPGRKRLCGESSTIYLRSKAAVPNLLEGNPRLKVIAIVRNPLQLVQSLHNENFKLLLDDEPDIERAWMLQLARARGERVPSRCPNPIGLDYRGMAMLGQQIDTLFSIVPENQRLVLVYDDLLTNSSAVLGRILAFLGVSQDFALSLPRSNPYSLPRSALAADLLRFLANDPRVNRLRARLGPLHDRVGINQIRQLFAILNERKVPKTPLRPAFREHLIEEFREDVALLSRVLGRDLSIWDGFAPTAQDPQQASARFGA